jgi:hypothetical protein
MNKKFNVQFFKKQFSQKPTKEDNKKISEGINERISVTVRELRNMVSEPLSYTVCPSIFNGKRSNDNWLSQEVFFLDFDGGITQEEAIGILRNRGLAPNIIYNTFSHTEENPKFRIILCADRPVEDKESGNLIRKFLINLFDGRADRSCGDASRMFYGGKNGIVLSEEPVNLDLIHSYAMTQLVVNDGMQTRKLQKYGNTYNSYRTFQNSAKTTNSSDCTNDRLDYIKIIKKVKFDWKSAQKRILILNDFAKGKELKYLQLFGLITNLVHFNGGEKFLKKTMKHFNQLGKTNYKQKDFALIQVCKKFNYYPQMLCNFSPYEQDHRFHNIARLIKKHSKEVQDYMPSIKISLEEAEKFLEEAFNKAISATDQSIYIIRAQTAIGKTKLLTSQGDATICFPTHSLVTEVSKRMNIEHNVVKELPNFENDFFNKKIKKFYQIGKYHQARSFIEKIENGELDNVSHVDAQRAGEFLAENVKIKKSKKTALTTHFRGVQESYIHQTIIFDEDPFQNLLKIKFFNISDLEILTKAIPNSQKIEKPIQNLKDCQVDTVYSTRSLGIEDPLIDQELELSDMQSDVFGFLSSDYCCKTSEETGKVYYCQHHRLPDDKKIIILSASPCLEFYKSVYGGRVKFFDIPLAENRGEIVQFTCNGFSRSSFEEHLNDQLMNRIGGKKVLTFKAHVDKFPHAVKDVYFGNCAGYDSLKGQDLAVVGTPHQDPIRYLFIAQAMGIDVNNLSKEMSRRKIEWNGFRFNFMSYEDERLRNIQLEVIESELVQAVGRSRSLRTDAQVFVFSNLPLRIASRIDYSYETAPKEIIVSGPLSGDTQTNLTA